ncbi:MAG TPA: hypothetical protein QGF58_26445 [Myxococcota bacterium]|nr:hypothetical protein [Myxococcota bacterium]
MSRSRAIHLLAVAVYVVIGIVTVSGGLLGGPDVIVGDLKHHAFEAAWFHAAVHEALTTWPPSYQTQLILQPEPFDVLGAIPDIGNQTLAVPLVALVGPLQAFDIVQVIKVAAAGLATYSLSFVLTRRHVPSLAAGALFAAASPIWFALNWGEDDVVAMWLLPAYLAVLFHALGEDGPPRSAVAPALAIAAVGYFNSYYLVFAATSTLVVGLTCLRRARAEPRAWLRFGGVYGLVAALAYLPRLLVGVRPTRMGTVETTAQVIFSVEDLLHQSPLYEPTSSLDLGGFFWPPHRPPGGEALIYEGYLYVGLAALGLAALGLFVQKARRGGLLLVGATGFVLACGAYVLWDGQTVGLGPLEVIPLPGGVLTAIGPVMDRMMHPYRFVILGFITIAVLGGSGAAKLAELTRTPAWVQAGLVFLLTAGALAERVWATPEIALVKSAEVLSGDWPDRLPETERPGILHLPLPMNRKSRHTLTEGSRYHIALQLLTHGRPLYIPAKLPLVQRRLWPGELEAQLMTLVEDGVGLVVLDGFVVSQCMGLGIPMPPETFRQLPMASANLETCDLEMIQLDPVVSAWILPDRPACEGAEAPPR